MHEVLVIDLRKEKNPPAFRLRVFLIPLFALKLDPRS
jgi:hypothetical protein